MKNLPKNKIINKQTRRTEFTESAECDLEEIWTYLNEDDSRYAEKLIKEFLQKFKMLAENPNLGKPRSEILIDLRSFPLKKYVIFYLPTDYGIEIFRVLHGSRNIDGIFDDFFDDLEMPENR